MVVLGAGPIGSILLQLALQTGATGAAVVEPNPERRERAAELGAALSCHPEAAVDAVREWSNGLGADVVIEASGRLEGAQLALQLVRRGGTVVWFGVYPETEPVPVSPYLVNENELTVRGSFNNPFTHAAALGVIAAHRLRLDELISDRLGLDRLAAALESGDRYAGKVLVVP